MQKMMSPEEAAKFITDSGLLFEINRAVLHPLGLALVVVQEDDGTIRFGGIWDNREDLEGIVFSDDLLREGANKLQEYMDSTGNKALDARRAVLGQITQAKDYLF